MGSNIFGLVPLAVGLYLALHAHGVLLAKLTTKSLEGTEATLGLFALRATLYLLIGGLMMMVVGAIALLGFIPWA